MYDFVRDGEHANANGDTPKEDPREHDSAPPRPAPAPAPVPLPISLHQTEIKSLINANQITIVSGSTGSGKTTQIPQYLAELGPVVCTQPRQLAAISVAQRVAAEQGETLGKGVGYAVRFDDCSFPETRIKFVTDGILLREFLADHNLSRYKAIMIDEAHERTLHTDILLTLLKQLCKRRPDLRLLISSATLDTHKFEKYFEARVYEVPGRTHPVEILYSKKPEPNYLKAAIVTIFEIHMRPEMGDILLFLPGQDEIETLAEELTDARNKLGTSIKELIICPLFANMPPHKQQQIFEPTPKNARKIILATNIAETSLTIPGVVFVIDPGFVKLKKFNPRSGMDSLTTEECSQASANQRSGRAGRVQPGKCYRLYPKPAFRDLPKEPTPEILRTNLAGVALLLLSIGVSNVLEFDFIDKPSPDALVQALQVLYSLGAVNDQCKLTKLGRQMVELPLEPVMAKTILESYRLGCFDSTCIIVAMLSELGQIFYRPKKRRQEADSAHKGLVQPGGDHPTLLYLYREWERREYSREWCYQNYIQPKAMLRARNVIKQLKRQCRRLFNGDNQTKSDLDTLRRAFVAGFVTNIAKLSNNGEFYTAVATSVPIHVHPSSTLFGEKPSKYIVYNEIVVTSKEYMRGCLACDSITL